MTTAPSVLPELPDVVALPDLPQRSRRRKMRRRLAREQIIVACVLVLALVATLVILGMQWLDSGGPTTTAPSAISTLSGGST